MKKKLLIAGFLLFLFLGLTASAQSPAINDLLPCPKKLQGDANCDGLINNVDYDIWTNEFKGLIKTSQLTWPVLNCRQAAFTDDFKTRPGTSESRWWVLATSSGTIVQDFTNDEVKTTILSDQKYEEGGIILKNKITGDFEIVVDLSSNQTTSGSLAHVELQFFEESWKSASTIGIDRLTDGTYRLYDWNMKDGVEQGGIGLNFPNGGQFQDGKPITVKVTRTGQVAKFYYKHSQGFFIELDTRSNIYSGDVKIRLIVNSDKPDFPSINGIFDNFSLSCPGERPVFLFQSDFNHDNKVDLIDFELWRENFSFATN